MTQKILRPTTPLIDGISQYQVDFVIPKVGIDLPLGIDPFLLYKSRDVDLSLLHSQILAMFNFGIGLIRDGKVYNARTLLSFPEVSEIGLGYTAKSKQGSGVGEFLSSLIVDTLLESPHLLQRGLKHIEELQLVSLGIGPDRVSDIAANLLKEHFIKYTQQQCLMWNIPLTKDVPVQHIFDHLNFEWYDAYFDLPLSPLDGKPILFVPRRVVRALPWINYNDFFRSEFTMYLRAKRVRNRLNDKDQSVSMHKEQVIITTRKEVERIDRYVAAKEVSAAKAQPTPLSVDTKDICPEVEILKEALVGILPGTTDSSKFQHLVLRILNFLFSPELIDGEMEVKTIDGTERRDIIYTNDSDQSFWAYLRTEHSSIFLMFETKNTGNIDNIYINQVATYLGDRLGRLGFIVTRKPLDDAQQRKIFSVYNDSHPRKVILGLCDADLSTMLDMKCQGKDPMRYLQKIYRTFRTKVQ